MSGGLCAIVLPLVEGRQHGWLLWTWVSLAAAPLSLGAFVLRQRRVAAGSGRRATSPHAMSAATLVRMSENRVGTMLRDWRHRRRLVSLTWRSRPESREPYPGYPGADDEGVPDTGQIMVELRLDSDAGELAFFSTVTTFGTAVDITVSELSIEAFFPADAATAAALGAAVAVG